MKFFTCASGKHEDLIPLYKFCAKKAYPEAEVEVRITDNPSFDRLLINPIGEYVHVTDIDIFILPHERSHEDYYSQYLINGASYLRGCLVCRGREWNGDETRISCGHIGFKPSYYEKTVVSRKYYSDPENREFYREFDEVMMYRILNGQGCTIPEKPYCFANGDPWNKEYRDLHLNDFYSVERPAFWAPDKKKIRNLLEDKEFKAMSKDINKKWQRLLENVSRYAL